jgi:hypothetical protein
VQEEKCRAVSRNGLSEDSQPIELHTRLSYCTIPLKEVLSFAVLFRNEVLQQQPQLVHKVFDTIVM